MSVCLRVFLSHEIVTSKHFKQLKSFLPDNKFFEMEQELQLTRQKLEARTAESDGSSRERGDLIARCSDLRQKLDSAEETRSSLEVENQSLKRDRDQASVL